MSRDDLHFRLRIPEELKKRVEQAAQDNKRSMTAEIVHRLEESFSPSRLSLPPAKESDAIDLNDPETDKYLRRIIKNIVVHGIIDIHALALLQKEPVPDELGTDDLFENAIGPMRPKANEKNEE